MPAAFSAAVALADDLGDACASAAINPTSPLIAQAGNQFAFALDTQPGTGNSWAIVQPPDPSVAGVLGSAVVTPQDVLPGGVEYQCFVLLAVAPGRTTIGLAYTRPFEPGAPPARSASIQIQVSAAGSPPVQIPANF
jgi:predicted secreted protein